MPLTQVPIGGLAALEGDELVPLDAALVADNCYVDSGQIVGRNGYRSVLPLATTIGTAGDLPQGIWRFRPSNTAARVVVASAGHVYLLTDPSTELLSDGALTDLGLCFGTTAKISGVQSGRYFYLFSDESPTKAYRISPLFALEALVDLGTPTTLTSVLATPTIFCYKTDSLATLGSSGLYVRNVKVNGGDTDIGNWLMMYGSASDTSVRPPVNATVTFQFSSAGEDWSNYTWLAVICAPAGANRLTTPGKISISVGPTDVCGIDLGKSWDAIQEATYGGPCIVYLPLSGLSSSNRAGLQYIKFANDGGDYWAVYGHCLLCTAPGGSTVQYAFTFKNSISGQRSDQSVALGVTVRLLNNAELPTYLSISEHKVVGWEGYLVNGTDTVDPSSVEQHRIANWEDGLAPPGRSEFSGIPSVSCAIPVASRYPLADTVELWRMCSDGYRLAGTKTLTGGEMTATITDGTGPAVLSAELYLPFGVQQQANAATARSGARLVAALGNTLSISSYIAPGATTDPIPSWPPIATQDWMGWNFQIAPSAAEQIVSVVNGDYLYVLTNQGVSLLASLDPNSPSYRTAQRGCVGRQAAIFCDVGMQVGYNFCEMGLVYAALDGIYMASGRLRVTEMSKPIRRLYASWFLPDSTVALGYQARKLYAFRGQRYLRYDLVTQTWTRGTLAGSVVDVACWCDPDAAHPEQMAILFADRTVARWQAAATSDLMYGATPGTPIPDWNYSTGLVIDGVKTKVDRLLVDATGPYRVGLSRTAQGVTETWRSVQPSQHGTPVEVPGWPAATSYQWRFQMSAGNLVVLRRLLWDRSGTDGYGGAKP